MKRRMLILLLVLIGGFITGCSNPPEEERVPQQYFLILDNYEYYLNLDLIITGGEEYYDPPNYVYTISRTNEHLAFKNTTIYFIGGPGGPNIEEIVLAEDGSALFTRTYPIVISSIVGIVQYTSYLDKKNPDNKVDLTMENYEDYILLTTWEDKTGGWKNKVDHYEYSGKETDALYVEVIIRYLDMDGLEQELKLDAGGNGKEAFRDLDLYAEMEVFAVEGSIYYF
jgi:hypothetical protein